MLFRSRTFGKGSVQTIMPMGEGAALKLTTARYFTPAGRSIQAEGIKPDIELGDLKLEKPEEDAKSHRVSEKDLSGHIDKGDKDEDAKKREKLITDEMKGEEKKGDAAADSKDKDSAEEEDKVKDLAQKDFALFEALNLLKGLHLLYSAR